ncbi:MAG: hypothetical protein JW881_04810 [Spirochaetales bacterium]|nr:hypothetical protein [Spirochaetales bacterium]
MKYTIHAFKKIFSLRKYSKELKLSPLFIETTVSILAGLFMFIWGVVFFSNPLYQFSLFTKLRNMMIPESGAEAYLEDIYCIGIDPEARLAFMAEDEGITYYDMIAEALDVIADYAENHGEKRVVAGIDYAFAAHEAAEVFGEMRRVLGGMPENMFVVFGGLLVRRPDTVTTLRSHLLEDRLYWPLTDIDPALGDRMFIGNLHVAKGSVRSGFENGEDIKAAIGYIPLMIWDRKTFCSMSLAMFLAGEVMEKQEDGRYDFFTDFAEGISRFAEESDIERRLEQSTGKRYHDLGKQIFYNFFTGRDILEFKNNYIWLSTVSPRFENSSRSLDNYFGQPFIKKNDSASGVEYFFVSQSMMPEFLLESGEENDVVLTPAVGENPFTYEKKTVMGVMSHVTALSNLRHRFYIDQCPSWLMIVLSILVIGAVLFFSWTKELGKSLLFSFGVITVFILVSFVSFCFGCFIPITTPFAFSLMTFGIIAILRFILTTNRYELYEMVASRVFSASQMEKLRDVEEWKRPKVIPDGVIMAVFPRKLPDFGKTEEDATRYTSIYEKYLSLVFKAIEHHEGNHLVLGMDGVLGFWNIPLPEEGSEARAFACARQCLDEVGKWQTFIDAQYGRKKAYIASFDICLHVCECYAGCVGAGSEINYSLSGSGINDAVEASLFQTGDRLNTLLVTKEFMDRLSAAGEVEARDFKELSYARIKLYQWKFTR